MLLFNDMNNLSEEVETLNQKLINIDTLSEDAIRLITKMNFLNDKEISELEFEEYLDNTILYFKSRLDIVSNIFRNQENNFRKLIRNLVKEINISEEFHINMKLRKPNDLYYKILSINILKDITNMTYERIYNNDDVTILYDIENKVYNKPLKLMSMNMVISKNKIPELYEKLSTEVYIKNKEEFKNYLTSLQFPSNDRSVIESYVKSVILELDQLKRLLKTNPRNFSKIVKSTNTVSILTMYRKNVINLMLNIYSVKISILNMSSNINECNIDEFSFVNGNIINESNILTEGRFKDIYIELNNMKNQYEEYLNNIEIITDNLYRYAIECINDIENKIEKNMYVKTNYIQDILSNNKIYNITTDNVDSYINMIRNDYSYNNMYLLKSESNVNDFINEINNNKKDIIDSLSNDYTIIKNRIDYLKNQINDVVNSNIFERPIKSLGVYSKDYLSFLQNEFRELASKNVYIDKIIFHIDITEFNIMMALRYIDSLETGSRDIKNKFMNIIYYLRNCYNNKPVENGTVCKTDKLLLCYLLYFKDKISKL